jgi:hypothetical protein
MHSYINVQGTGVVYTATLSLANTPQSWAMEVIVSLHPTISELPLANRLGDYRRPWHSSQRELDFLFYLTMPLNKKSQAASPLKTSRRLCPVNDRISTALTA